MLKLGSIKTPDASDEGVWVDVPEWPGVRFKVRRIGSRDYQIARELLVQRKSKALQRVPTSPEMEPELGKLVARFLLRGWEGIAGDDEKSLDWTPEVGLETLTDPSMGQLERMVLWAASSLEETNADFTLAAVGNSKTPSATS